MRKTIFIFITSFSVISACFAQRLPNDIQERIDTLQHRARIALYNYNINPNMGRLYYFPLHPKFSPPIELWEKSDKYNLNLGIIYDNAMRDRLAELVQNKYQESELDTLVNRYIVKNIKWSEQDAMKLCRFDTLSFLQVALDSFYINLEKKEMSKTMYTYTVFKQLQLDTIKIFKQAYQQVIEQEREKKRESILTNKSYYRAELARLCGEIGDERFIKPLIEALDKPDNFKRETVLEALARMRVEPYHSEYVKFRMPRTMEQIKNESPGFKIDDFVYVLGTQEAFLELSKYLLSDYMYSIDMASAAPDNETYSHITPMSIGALMLIRENIENKDLQAIFPDRFTYKHPELAQPVYDWMQKNYGKYKIKRIW